MSSDVHLIVVGERKEKPESIIDDVATEKVKEQGRSRLLRRCGSPDDLVEVVRNALREGQLVVTLDLYDHGRPGAARMGSGVLFDHTGVGRARAEALREHLTQNARVRLLGCNTAMLAEGRTLLLELQSWLGGERVVFGTNHNTEPADFDDVGFKAIREKEYLFSSVEARARESPTLEQRQDEIDAGYIPPVR